MRFIFLSTFFFLLFGVLSLNLYQLQINKGFYYFNKVQARNEVLKELALRRGQIFFTDKYKNNIPVAIQKDYPVIYSVPNEIKDFKDVSHKLAPIVNINEDKLRKILKNKKSKFRLLVDKAPKDMISSIKLANIKGIYVDKKQYRHYSFNELGSHIIGYVGLNKNNAEATGLYGIEKMFNKKLSSGNDVKLTIDRDLQTKSERELTSLIKKFNASGGTIIIQEPDTGKILTLANKPSFNPNFYSNYSLKNFINSAVQYVYEPGSVFKPITMAAGIDTGVITPETTFEDKGSITLNGRTIRNWDLKAHGKITMTNVIEKSVNTGAVFAESKVGNKVFLEYLEKFGFGKKTNIDLPDEVSGSLRNLKKKRIYQVDFATAAFGQGVSVTPIELVSAFSTIANGGLLMRPFVIRGTKPKVVRRVIKEDTARKVTKMMESAVEKARVAAIQHYNIAGKTGTAFIPEKGGYSHDKLIQTFVGFLPASNPKVVVLIKLEKPDAPLAGRTVVPAFRELASFIINYYNIPPDKPIN